MQRLRRLARRRSSRSQDGHYLVDGPVLVAEAMASGVAVDALYVEPGADTEVVAAAVAAEIQVMEVAEGSLRKVLDLVSPQAMVALARQAPASVGSIVSASVDRARPMLVLVGIQDPGNAGTLIRVAEGSGCVGVAFTDGSVDPWNPKVVRSSAGAIFRVPVADRVPVGDLMTVVESAGLTAVATVRAAAAAPDEIDLTGATALLIGAEAHGLEPEVVSRATTSVTIPMEGEVESLNAAVAGALLAFEAARQRRVAHR